MAGTLEPCHAFLAGIACDSHNASIPSSGFEFGTAKAKANNNAAEDKKEDGHEEEDGGHEDNGALDGSRANSNARGGGIDAASSPSQQSDEPVEPPTKAEAEKAQDEMPGIEHSTESGEAQSNVQSVLAGLKGLSPATQKKVLEAAAKQGSTSDAADIPPAQSIPTRPHDLLLPAELATWAGRDDGRWSATEAQRKAVSDFFESCGLRLNAAHRQYHDYPTAKVVKDVASPGDDVFHRLNAIEEYILHLILHEHHISHDLQPLLGYKKSTAARHVQSGYLEGLFTQGLAHRANLSSALTRLGGLAFDSYKFAWLSNVVVLGVPALSAQIAAMDDAEGVSELQDWNRDAVESRANGSWAKETVDDIARRQLQIRTANFNAYHGRHAAGETVLAAYNAAIVHEISVREAMIHNMQEYVRVSAELLDAQQSVRLAERTVPTSALLVEKYDFSHESFLPTRLAAWLGDVKLYEHQFADALKFLGFTRRCKQVAHFAFGGPATAVGPEKDKRDGHAIRAALEGARPTDLNKARGYALDAPPEQSRSPADTAVQALAPIRKYPVLESQQQAIKPRHWQLTEEECYRDPGMSTSELIEAVMLDESPKYTYPKTIQRLRPVAEISLADLNRKVAQTEKSALLFFASVAFEVLGLPAAWLAMSDINNDIDKTSAIQSIPQFDWDGIYGGDSKIFQAVVIKVYQYFKVRAPVMAPLLGFRFTVPASSAIQRSNAVDILIKDQQAHYANIKHVLTLVSNHMTRVANNPDIVSRAFEKLVPHLQQYFNTQSDAARQLAHPQAQTDGHSIVKSIEPNTNPMLGVGQATNEPGSPQPSRGSGTGVGSQQNSPAAYVPSPLTRQNSVSSYGGGDLPGGHGGPRSGFPPQNLPPHAQPPTWGFSPSQGQGVLSHPLSGVSSPAPELAHRGHQLQGQPQYGVQQQGFQQQGQPQPGHPQQHGHPQQGVQQHGLQQQGFQQQGYLPWYPQGPGQQGIQQQGAQQQGVQQSHGQQGYGQQGMNQHIYAQRSPLQQFLERQRYGTMPPPPATSFTPINTPAGQHAYPATPSAAGTPAPQEIIQPSTAPPGEETFGLPVGGPFGTYGNGNNTFGGHNGNTFGGNNGNTFNNGNGGYGNGL